MQRLVFVPVLLLLTAVGLLRVPWRPAMYIFHRNSFFEWLLSGQGSSEEQQGFG